MHGFLFTQHYGTTMSSLIKIPHVEDLAASNANRGSATIARPARVDRQARRRPMWRARCQPDTMPIAREHSQGLGRLGCSKKSVDLFRLASSGFGWVNRPTGKQPPVGQCAPVGIPPVTDCPSFHHFGQAPFVKASSLCGAGSGVAIGPRALRIRGCSPGFKAGRAECPGLLTGATPPEPTANR